MRNIQTDVPIQEKQALLETTLSHLTKQRQPQPYYMDKKTIVVLLHQKERPLP